MTTLALSAVLLLAQAGAPSEPLHLQSLFTLIKWVTTVLGVLIIIGSGIRYYEDRDTFRFFTSFLAGAVIAGALQIYYFLQSSMPVIDYKKVLTVVKVEPISVGYLHPKHEGFSLMSYK